MSGFREVTIGECRLILGDAIEVIPTLKSWSIDSVITDPPYMIGAKSVGTSNSKSGTWADMMNVAQWYAQWIRSCVEVAGAGYVAAFGNWRSLPTYIRAFDIAGQSVTSCMVWDKQWIGPAYKNALRPTWELVAISAVADALIPNRSASDVFRGEKWLAGACQTTGHPAEKPIDVCRYLIEAMVLEGGTVLDPFMGSGSMAIAAIESRRKYVGIEVEQEWFDIACRRIEQAYADQGLYTGAMA